MRHRSPSLAFALSLGSALVALPLHAQETPAPAAAPSSPPGETTPAAPAAPPPATPSQTATPGAPLAPSPLAPTQLAKPIIDVHVPDEGPPAQRTVHMHEGFYFRGSVGPLLGRTGVATDTDSHPSYSVSGPGLGLDLMVGGSPNTGLALGGGLSLDGWAPGSGSGTAGLGMIGAFVDGFPQPNQGFHLGGMLGLAGVRATHKGGLDDLKAGGVGMAMWLGQDWWVADEWSAGGLLRLSGALSKDGSHDKGADPVSLTGSTFELALMFTVLCH